MSNFTPTDGSDIESALDIIEANGGGGEFEGGEKPAIPRWLFPRFDGATADGDMYLSRSGVGDHDTDVETLVSWLDAPRNVVGAIFLEGDPGTGKTALIEAAVTHADRTLRTHLCTPDDTRESLFLRFVGDGNGENGGPYVKGVIPQAVADAATLYLDEALMLNDGVKPITYELTDGRRYLSGGNVDGTDLLVPDGFRVVMSSNPLVRGASLPEPLASRVAGTTMTVETSADMLEALGIDESIVAAWQALGNAGLWRPAIRELRVANYWMQADITQATSAMVAPHCPESQRKSVRDTVVSLMGGDLRADGRLVVS